MDAAGQLAQLGEPAGEIVLRRGQNLPCGPRVALELLADHAQPEGDRDESLLSAVVQVALEPRALGVADLDEARPRCGELLVGVGIGQRLRDELGEVAQPLLEPLGQASSDVVAAASTPHSLPPTLTGAATAAR